MEKFTDYIEENHNMTALTTQQRTALLEECEAGIEKGVKSVSDLLNKIREDNLWDLKYASWDDYCQKRWGYTGRHGRRLIQSGETISQVLAELSENKVGHPMAKVGPIGPTLVSHQALTSQLAKIPEAAARELTRIPPPKRAEVFTAASLNGTIVPTATAIKKAFGPPPEITPKLVPPKLPSVLDAIGREIPADIVSLWQRAVEVKDILNLISKARTGVQKAEDDQHVLFAGVNYSSILADLNNAYNSVTTALPYTVCPSCQGQAITRPTCRLCHKRGFISAFTWKTSISEEQKRLVLSTLP